MIQVSGTYPGYTLDPVNDGDLNPYGMEATTWASDDNPSAPRWIECIFPASVSLNSIVLYWAWNPTRSKWMTSQEYKIQHWLNNDWVDLKTVNNSTLVSVTTSGFPVTETSRLRLYQPANSGPEGYEEILWIAEIEVYSIDKEPPQAPTDLRE
jgi:hypothetical protein